MTSKAANPSWSFACPTAIRFGAGAWRQAAEVCRDFGARVMLVSGSGTLERSGLIDQAVAMLRASGLAVARMSVPGEPDTTLVDAGGVKARAERCEVVLAIGGGSAMDAAKGIAALATNPGSARDYLEGVPGGGRELAVPALPIVCVPSTAGTGAEVTRNAVIGVPDLRVKRSMRSPSLVPRVALIDPELSGSAPPKIAAACGFDALTHLVESFCSVNAQPISDALARAGIPLAVAGLRALESGASTAASREGLALAALWGGMCLANTGLGAAHGLVAPLGGMFPVPHGAALACLLPTTLLVNDAALAARDANGGGRARLREVAALVTGRPAATVAEAASELTGLRRNLGLPGLSGYGVNRDGIPAVVAAPSGSLKTNPLTLTGAELTEILERALD